MTVPITPEQAIKKHAESIPSFVIESVNELIAKKITQSRYITLKQDDLVELIMLKGGILRQTIFEENMLEIEYLYSQWGWDVKYDSDDKTFIFRKKVANV